MKFQGFQNLYQHLKGADIKLFETCNKVSSYLQTISNELNDLAGQSNLQIAYSTAPLALTGVITIIPGAFIRLSGSGTYLITACFDMVIAGALDIGTSIVGSLLVGGIVQIPVATFQNQVQQSRVTTFQQWMLVINSDNQLVQLAGNKVGGTGASFINTAFTSISALRVR